MTLGTYVIKLCPPTDTTDQQCTLRVDHVSTSHQISPQWIKIRLIVFCARCASCALDVSVGNYAQDLRKILSQCAIYAQDLRKILSQCARLYFFPQCTIYAQHMRKIVLISPMHNICARFAQDCTYFPNAQYMRKICARLYLFLQMRNICAIFTQDCISFPNAQYMRKIVLISPMCNICTRFAQDCTSLPNVQRLQALLEEICHISHICCKFRMVFTS